MNTSILDLTNLSNQIHFVMITNYLSNDFAVGGVSAWARRKIYYFYSR
jgi:hypothetical protein